MARCKVGVQFWPQHAEMAPMREAWEAADAMGVDSLWVWDHFYPLMGEAEGKHFEGWTTLAAMAATTSNAMLGTLVTGIHYRNVDLLADMARTVDHLSNGRAYLGIGSGWFEKDYDEYGFEFGTAGSRLRDLDAQIPRLKARLAKLNPAPIGSLPIMIGGGGEKVTLRIVAEQADAWNSFGPPVQYAKKNAILDEWCEKVGRDPAEIERTVALMQPAEIDQFEYFLDAGATHIILGMPQPFDLAPVQRLLDLAKG